jgi:DNA-binding winged helix-turn-helix (wHTH) protein
LTYSFGPFQLDVPSRRLLRNREPVALPDRQVDILLLLVARAGQILSKDALIEAAWKDVAVTDNSLEQAISSLRRTLGSSPDGPGYIETLARRGYRFAAPVTQTASRVTPEALDAMLAPHRAFVEGRAALETLERDAVARACSVFADVAEASPDYAPAHLGLANALALHFESTRVDSIPDRDSLRRAIHHASEACRLDPMSGEAWAALGLVYHQSRESARAIAAARRAVELQPENWRHHVRLAYVSWGEERLRAAHRALQLLPHLALAHWLAASVYIARQAFAEAEHELVRGAAAQDDQQDARRFTAVGLHLLLGLVRLASGDEAAAVRELQHELDLEPAAHIYAREAHANTWCGLGAVRLRRGERISAVDAFERALAIVPGHTLTLAASSATADEATRSRLKDLFDARLADLRKADAFVDAAIAEAAYETLRGRVDQAATLVHAAMEAASVGSAGWTVPVEPLLHVSAHAARWAPTLALIRNRAA